MEKAAALRRGFFFSFGTDLSWWKEHQKERIKKIPSVVFL
jgi:hypothetical protein